MIERARAGPMAARSDLPEPRKQRVSAPRDNQWVDVGEVHRPLPSAAFSTRYAATSSRSKRNRFPTHNAGNCPVAASLCTRLKLQRSICATSTVVSSGDVGVSIASIQAVYAISACYAND